MEDQMDQRKQPIVSAEQAEEDFRRAAEALRADIERLHRKARAHGRTEAARLFRQALRVLDQLK
jgi:phosphoenolpyruvate-protein kinase (PTS system EI component)